MPSIPIKPFTLLYGSGKAYYIIIHELYAYLITSAYILQSKSNNNAANVQCFNCHNSYFLIYDCKGNIFIRHEQTIYHFFNLKDNNLVFEA